MWIVHLFLSTAYTLLGLLDTSSFLARHGSTKKPSKLSQRVRVVVTHTGCKKVALVHKQWIGEFYGLFVFIDAYGKYIYIYYYSWGEPTSRTSFLSGAFLLKRISWKLPCICLSKNRFKKHVCLYDYVVKTLSIFCRQLVCWLTMSKLCRLYRSRLSQIQMHWRYARRDPRKNSLENPQKIWSFRDPTVAFRLFPLSHRRNPFCPKKIIKV